MPDNDTWDQNERRKPHECKHETKIALMKQDIENTKKSYHDSIAGLKNEMEKTTQLSLEILETMKGNGSRDKPGILTELAVTKEDIKRLRVYLGGIASIVGGYLLTKIKW